MVHAVNRQLPLHHAAGAGQSQRFDDAGIPNSWIGRNVRPHAGFEKPWNREALARQRAAKEALVDAGGRRLWRVAGETERLRRARRKHHRSISDGDDAAHGTVPRGFNDPPKRFILLVKAYRHSRVAHLVDNMKAGVGPLPDAAAREKMAAAVR